MLKPVFLFIFCLCSTYANCQQCNVVNGAYDCLINYFLTDTLYTNAGSLLPYPGQRRNNNKQLSIHLINKIQYDDAIKKRAVQLATSPLTFINCKYKNTSQFLQRGVLDTSVHIYKQTNKQVLGTLFLTGCYVEQKKQHAGYKFYVGYIRAAQYKSKTSWKELAIISFIEGKYVLEGVINIDKS